MNVAVIKPEYDLFSQPPLKEAVRERDRSMRQVQVNAGAEFSRAARAFVLQYLALHSEASGEDITDACKAAGIVPPNDDRAFGPVFMRLIRDQLIAKTGECIRRKGHASAGGKLYALTKQSSTT